MSGLLLLALVGVSLLMSAQAAYTVYLMLYTWDHDSAYEAARAPQAFRLPQISFTALLPAHHEEEVIAYTLERIMHAHYPHRLLEAIVICAKDDRGTIDAAQAAIDRLGAQGITGARVLVFDDTQLNKPHRLNVALPRRVATSSPSLTPRTRSTPTSSTSSTRSCSTRRCGWCRAACS